MRQAIEEGFILDVLKGYTTYKRFFQLAKSVADDPELDKQKAASALARFVNLHPSNIAQKTEIIIEHFRACVMHRLKGRAKAMLVTSSRLMAVKYKQAFDAYLKDKGYADVRCLVAFSGEVDDDAAPGVKYTEPQMNTQPNGRPIKETELPPSSRPMPTRCSSSPTSTRPASTSRCSAPCTWTSAWPASRRCRPCPGSTAPTPARKRPSCSTSSTTARPSSQLPGLLRGTTTAEAVDPQRLYELQHELDEFQVYTASEIDGFAAVFYQLDADKRLSDNAKLNAWLDPAVDRFKALKARRATRPVPSGRSSSAASWSPSRTSTASSARSSRSATRTWRSATPTPACSAASCRARTVAARWTSATTSCCSPTS
jgi:type I restriction enzyme R subunit